MANRIDFLPSGMLFSSEAFPQRAMANSNTWVLYFDPAVAEYAQVGFEAPADLTGPFYVDLDWATTATAGNVKWDVAVEAVTPADALNVLTSSSYAAVNSAGVETVPATAGYLKRTVVTLTNHDSMAAGDRVRLLISRDAPTDTCTADVALLGVAFRDSA